MFNGIGLFRFVLILICFFGVLLSASSEAATFGAPAVPTISATRQDSNIRIDWSDVSDECVGFNTVYQLFESVDGQNWNQVYSGSGNIVPGDGSSFSGFVKEVPEQRDCEFFEVASPSRKKDSYGVVMSSFETISSSVTAQQGSVSRFVTLSNRNGPAYHFKIRACFNIPGDSCSGFSNTSSLVVPPKPSFLNVPSLIVDNGSILLSWPKSLDTISYTIQESFNGRAWVLIGTYLSSTTSLTLSNKINGNYRYQIKSCNLAGCSGWMASNIVNVLSTVQSISVPTTVVKNGEISIGWPSVSNAKTYTIQESINDGVWNTIGAPATTSYILSGKENGRYKYQVRACSSAGCSGWRVSTVVNLLSNITGINVPTSTVTSGSVLINWPSVSTATRYILYVDKGESKTWTPIGVYTGNSYTHTGIVNGIYRYSIEACTNAVCSDKHVSTTVNVLSDVLSISVPASTVVNGSIGISWQPVSTATNYTLQESVNNGPWLSIVSPSTNSYTRTGRSNGSYKYRVRACNAMGCSSWRTSGAVNVLSNVTAITVPTSTVTNGNISISWPAVTTASSYTLQESVNNGVWTTIVSPTSTSYTRTGRTNGSYKYQVRACNAAGCSGWRASGSVTVVLPPPVPASISVPTSTVTNGSIAISWAASSTASSYTLQESVNNGAWATVVSPTSTSYTRTGRPNGSYKYQVRACNAFSCSGWRVSSAVNVLTLDGAVNAVVSGNGVISISWSTASTATSYTLQERVNGGVWSTIASPTSSPYTRSGLGNGNYQYQVRACNAAGCSGWRVSGSVTVVLPPPVPASISVPTSTVTNGSITIDWQPSSNATSYTLQQKLNNGAWATIASPGSNSHNQQVQSSGSYQYQVRACNTSGCSGWKVSTSVIVEIPPEWLQTIPTQVADAGGSNAEPSETIDLTSASIPGNASVSGGQASYNIPIPTPPGRGGMQPKISLSYSSQGGNGIVGVGWSLNAGSAINRCGATFAQDGFTRAVTFNANTDRLCLDGQRLAPVSGLYGASGTVYTTETESFVRIRQSGSINSSTVSFTLLRQDGTIKKYGANTNSRFSPLDLTTVLTWKITEELDSSGNSIEYSYDDSVPGEHLLESITYAGKNVGVMFGYEDKPESTSGYFAGGRLVDTRRLTAITFYINSEKLDLQYLLSYGQSETSGKSILTSIERCQTQSDCLVTNFNWFERSGHIKTNELLLDGQSTFSDKTLIGKIVGYGDFNGDGSNDFIGYNTNSEQELISTNSLTINDVCRFTGSITARRTCLNFDLDNDGIVDLYKSMGNELYVKYSSGGDFLSTGIKWDERDNNLEALGWPVYQDRIVAASDMNGDGLVDIVMYDHDHEQLVRTGDKSVATYSSWYIYFNTGDKNSPFTSGKLIRRVTDGVPVTGSTTDIAGKIPAVDYDLVGDVNGDGLPDFVLVDRSLPIYGPMRKPIRFIINKSSGSNWSATEISVPEIAEVKEGGDRRYFYRFVDINGDGTLDIICWAQISTNNYALGYMLNKGNVSFVPWTAFEGSAELVDSHVEFKRGPEIFSFSYPRFMSAMNFLDLDFDGKLEWVLPGKRLITGCAKNVKGTVFCGDQLYGSEASYYQNGLFRYPTKATEQDRLDGSIHQYDAIYFKQSPSGRIRLERKPTQYYGGAVQSRFTDAFGDGLLDLVTAYGPYYLGVSNPELESRAWIKDAGTSIWGTNWGGYISRNFGAGNGATPSDFQPVDYLQSVTDNHGNTASWRYRPLSTGEPSAGQNKMYQTDHPAAGDGYVNFSSSMYVVQSFKQSSGQGEEIETQYAYKGAMYNLEGRGFTGFNEIWEKDMQRGKTVHTVFRQKFPEVGLPTKQTVSADAAASPILHTTYTWADNPNHSINGVVHNVRTSAHTISTDLDGTLMSETLVTVDPAQVDEYGNIKEQVTLVTDYPDGSSPVSYQTTVTSVFDPQDNGTEWWTNKLTSTTTKTKVSSRDWGSDLVAAADTEQWQTQQLVWDTTHKKPQSITYTASGTADNRIESTVYNSYGLPESVTVSAPGVTARTTAFSYTKDGQTAADDGYLPFKVTNAKLHVTETHYNMALGLPVKVIDPNGLVTETDYDPIGRPVEIRQSGKPTQYLRYLLASSGTHAPEHAATLVRTSGAGMPTAEVYFDARGRQLRAASQGFDSGYVYQDKTYDGLGRLIADSQTYDAGGSGNSTEFGGFDALDRPSYRILPNGYNGGLRSEYRYQGQTTHITVEGRNMSRTYGSQGLLYQTVDALDGSNRFAYDGAGRPLVIQDANGNNIVASYNGFGHKSKVVDPNQGTTDFVYNALGELTWQKDANGAEQSFKLDSLGRLYEKTTAGSNANGTAVYTWDSRKKGLLSQESENGVDRDYQYDGLSRMSQLGISVDGTTRTVKHQYDSFYGRPKGLEYPNGLTLAYGYNAAGYLNQVSNAASGYVYREVTQMDAQGHITGAEMGNGLLKESRGYTSEGNMRFVEVDGSLGRVHGHYYDSYDTFMNLMAERNGVTGLNKSYDYDELQRLKEYTFANQSIGQGAFSNTVYYDYDAVGNLLKKTDYSANKVNAYQYGSQCSDNSKPNAVCQVEKLGGQLVSFSYDNRGNLRVGDGLTTTYNALDKPLSISGRGAITQFVYGSDNMRARQTRTVGSKTTTTYYVDKLYEADNDGSWRAYIADAAVLSYSPEQSHKLMFTLRDRLGSATTMVNQAGTVVSRRYFDPFGRTADISSGSGLLDAAKNHSLDIGNKNTASSKWQYLAEVNNDRRGFTDHEHLNEQQLIHMNGRVYDYNLGRFMSVDPLIQSPTSTQSINPYSYIMNNPLAGTDPTGYMGCAASRIEKVCNSTLSHWGGNGKADASFFGGNKGGGVSVKSNGNNSYTASFQLNKNTTLEVDFKVSSVGSLGANARKGGASGNSDPLAEKEAEGMKFVPGGYGLSSTIALPAPVGAGAATEAAGAVGSRVTSMNPLVAAVLAAVYSSSLNAGEAQEFAKILAKNDEAERQNRLALGAAINDARARGEDYITLFRTASPVESADIRNRGVFSMGPLMFPKQFTLNVDDALAFSRFLPTEDRPFSIFSARISLQTAASMFPNTDPVRGHGTIFYLTAMTPAVLNSVNVDARRFGGIFEVK